MASWRPLKKYFCVLSDLVAKAAILAKRGIRMTWAIRSYALAAAAAAMLSSQAVYAAPVATQATTVDPLVSLSVLGTTQSRGAFCVSAAAACASGSVMAASMAATAVAQDAPPPANSGTPKSMTLPLILGLLALIGIAAAVLSGGGNGHGDLTPISPD
jgi:hypothetical protein